MENQTEGDFGVSLRSFRTGSESFHAVMGHSECQRHLRRFAYGYSFSVFHGDMGPEDLCQEVSLKLLDKAMHNRLHIPGNIQTEDQFFSWLFVVVYRHYLSALRQHRALKRDGLRSDKPVEDYFDLPAPQSNQWREQVLSFFPEFIRIYPLERQLAVRLWLKNKPSRRIQKILLRLGFDYCHVTILNWVNAIVEDFAKSPDLPDIRTGT